MTSYPSANPISTSRDNHDVLLTSKNHLDADLESTSADLRRWLRPTYRDGQPVVASTDIPHPKCFTCQMTVSFMEFLEKVEAEPDVEYEFDPVMDEYDPYEDPDEALWNEYYNPDSRDYIDGLRDGYYGVADF